MNQQKYDYIVIGAGISGLLVANMLLAKGKRILVLEKNKFSGGFYAQFCNQKYEMDYTTSYFLGVEKNSPMRRFLSSLNLEHTLSFTQVPIADHYIFPDFEFSLKSDYAGLKKDLSAMFPHEHNGIDVFFDILKKVSTSLKLNKFDSLFRDTSIRKYMDKSYQFFMNDLFEDEKLKAILSARVFGSKVSMMTMVSYLGKIIFEGDLSRL